MHELTLRVTQNPGTIEINFDELEKSLDQKLSQYKGALITEESKVIAKKEVAELRKLKAEINEAKKGVKAEWMKPYDQFEAGMKRLMAKVDEPINLIDQQVKELEEQRKAKKKEDINELYLKLTERDPSVREYAPIEKIYNEKWENASVTMKSVTDDLTILIEKTSMELQVISSMESEVKAEALTIYRNTRDMAKAVVHINEYERRKAEILERERKQKEEEEERKKQAEIERIRREEREAIEREERAKREALEEAKRILEQDSQKKEESVVPAEKPFAVAEEPSDELPFVQPNTRTVIYRVVATEEELEAVEMAFASIGIYFERRDG